MTIRQWMAMISIAIPSAVFGWGAGHDEHAKLVLQHLPQDLKSEWKTSADFVKYCHAPDGMTMKEAQKAISADDNLFLKDCQFKESCFPFHSSEGRGLAFYLLTKAFHEKNEKAAAFYAGNLLHAIADANAFNHGPLIHHYTYTRYPHVKYPIEGHQLDLSLMRTDKQLVQSVEKRLAGGVKCDPLPADFSSAILSVMLGAIDANRYMTARENQLVIPGKEGKLSEPALNAMADIAAYQTREGVNVIYAAWQFSKRNVAFDLKPGDFNGRALRAESSPRPGALLNRYHQHYQRLIRNCSPKEDSVYSGLFDETKKPFIGILCEATYVLNSSFLGFGSKFILASSARTLLKNGYSIRMLPVFSYEKKDLPSPSEMPILIAGTRIYNTRVIRDYQKQGGKLLLIGGSGDNHLTGLPLVKGEIGMFPVKDSYGKAETNWNRVELIPAGEFGKTIRTLKFKANPNCNAGWNKPICRMIVSEKDSSVIPLFHQKDENQIICIAAAKKTGNLISSVWLPQYLLMPFLFSDDSGFPDWSKPELDSVGSRILLAAVEMLSPLGLIMK